MRKQKIVSVALALLLLLGGFAGSATIYAAETPESDFSFDQASGTITKYTGSDTTVTIPATIGGVPVTAIKEFAFYNCSSLTSVTIPDSVTRIEATAFHSCSSLTSVTIPDSVTTIGESAFAFCSALTNVTIPDSVTTIEGSVFFGCSALTSITIPDSVTTIKENVFYECYALTSVTIPDSVTSIGSFAFGSCTSLNTVYFEGNQPFIRAFAFDNRAIAYYSTSDHAASFVNVSPTVVPSYLITIDPIISNGTIRTNVASGMENSDIGLMIKPDSGYCLRSGSLKYNDGSDHSINEATASFKMPSKAVTVTGAFQLINAAPVDLAEIGGVSAPVKGAVPVTAITETAQYTGTVSWNPNNNPFVADTAYTATITLSPKAGYTLSGVAANYFTVVGASTASNGAGSGVITAVFPKTAEAPVDLAAIGGVSAPVRGAVPVATITETAQYTGTVSWSPNDNPFGADTAYTATITLSPKAGYTLSGVAANYFTVVGASTASNGAGSGVITAVFPKTAEAPVDLAAIGGVSAPVRGAVPVTAITETAQYTGTVSWSPNDNPFVADTAYTATITLSPKAGYTLSGVAANYFTVVGASTASNGAGSGVITAVFPKTAEAPVDLAAIGGVSAPVRGAVPVATITETAQYTGTVSWSPDNNPFGADTAYTATITLSPKAGYTLSGVAANYFTVAGASTASNGAGSGVITAVFPKTTLAPVVSGGGGRGGGGTSSGTVNTIGDKVPSNLNNPFVDIKESHWFYDSVLRQFRLGLMNGTSNTTFSPHLNTSRAMIVTILYRLEKANETSYSSFEDVANDQYYAHGVAWAQKTKIVEGTGHSIFGSNNNITREEMVTTLYRYAQYKKYDTSKTIGIDSFNDASRTSDWAKAAMEWAVANNIISGKGSNTLDPQGVATRAEIATVLMNFIDSFKIVVD